jgi:hypothetical protein
MEGILEVFDIEQLSMKPLHHRIVLGDVRCVFGMDPYTRELIRMH